MRMWISLHPPPPNKSTQFHGAAFSGRSQSAGGYMSQEGISCPRSVDKLFCLLVSDRFLFLWTSRQICLAIDIFLLLFVFFSSFLFLLCPFYPFSLFSLHTVRSFNPASLLDLLLFPSYIFPYLIYNFRHRHPNIGK